VPINPKLVDEFDPDGVPTVGDLLNELDRIPVDTSEGDVKKRMEGRPR
jgi:DNA primase small subunit